MLIAKLDQISNDQATGRYHPSVHSAQPATDFLIVGGGICGLSLAAELIDLGASVRVLDMASAGMATSNVAAGMIHPLSEFEPELPESLTLGLESANLWPDFASELQQATGINVDLQPLGTLAVARDRDEAEALERSHQIRLRHGIDSQKLLASQTRRLEPALAPTIRSGLLTAGELVVDPRKVVTALRKSVEARGGLIVESAQADQLVTHKDRRVIGVATSKGNRYLAGTTIICAGPWSGKVLGVQLPIRPVQGQLLIAESGDKQLPVKQVIRCGPTYLVPRSDGRLLIGASTLERGFSLRSEIGALFDLLRDATELVPQLRELQIVETQVGLRPTTPDGLPLIGWAGCLAEQQSSAARTGGSADHRAGNDRLEGLFVNAGHYRNGVLLAPLSAKLSAAMLLQGVRSGSAPPTSSSSPNENRIPFSQLAAITDPSRFF